MGYISFYDSTGTDAIFWSTLRNFDDLEADSVLVNKRFLATMAFNSIDVCVCVDVMTHDASVILHGLIIHGT